MKRILIGERPNWKEQAEAVGFKFHTMYGEPYWDEQSVYEFTLDQVENDIEDPSTELHAMCREAVAKIVTSEDLMTRLGIPQHHWDFVAQSWADQEPELYGRFDLVYDGTGPAKMLEYNADTPTSLFEAASFQWTWLEDMIATLRLPKTADQFNGVYEALIERFKAIYPANTDIHFSAFESMLEDYSTVEMLGYAAREAGMGAHFVDIAKIGITDQGQFADDQSRVIGTLFKLYPWEDMLRDDFSANLATSQCRFLEPAWKSVVSNKGILPVLWEMFEGHPNLLPSFFADQIETSPLAARAQDQLQKGFVSKPIFSREGASITITENGSVLESSTNTDYNTHPTIIQAYAPMPVYDGYRPIIGAWVVGQTCVGMGLREDRSRITQDLSRFKPHYILG